MGGDGIPDGTQDICYQTAEAQAIPNLLGTPLWLVSVRGRRGKRLNKISPLVEVCIPRSSYVS